MASNEDPNSPEASAPPPPKHRRNNSMTKCLSAGPMAAASRLMSSLTKPSRTSSTLDTENIHEQPSVPLARRRSSSPDSTSSNMHLINSAATTSSDLNQVTIEMDLPNPESIDSNFNFESICVQLRDLAETNSQYFSKQKTDVCRRFTNLLTQLMHSLELSIPLIRYLTDNFHLFDYSPEVNFFHCHSQSSLICLFVN